MLHKLFLFVVLFATVTALLLTSVPQLLSYPDTVFNLVGVFGILCYIYLCIFAFPKMVLWALKVKPATPRVEPVLGDEDIHS